MGAWRRCAPPRWRRGDEDGRGKGARAGLRSLIGGARDGCAVAADFSSGLQKWSCPARGCSELAWRLLRGFSAGEHGECVARAPVFECKKIHLHFTFTFYVNLP